VGLALTVAVAFAAWWTSYRPSEAATRRALPEFAEPSPWPGDPIEEIAAEPEEELATAPNEDVATEPAEQIVAETEQQPVKPPPRRPRRKRRPGPNAESPVSNDSQFQKPPDLVTEW
jgi:hypothetical protein